MRTTLAKIWQTRYKPHIRDPRFIATFISSLILLIASLFINFFAGTYATRLESNPVTDVILSNTRVYDFDNLFIYGAFTMCFFIALLCILDPKKTPFILKSIALFTIIRSVFISLTHIAPFPTHIVIDPSSLINKFTFDGDLFFSGHAGLPYLMSLIYWKFKGLRYIFLFLSAFFGVVVLLAHLHYTIDVVAAFFITYSIYHLAELFFRKDRKLFFYDSYPQKSSF